MNVAVVSFIVLLFCNFGKFVHKVVNSNVLFNCKKSDKFKQIFKGDVFREFVQRADEPGSRKGKDPKEKRKHFFHYNAYDPNDLLKYRARDSFKDHILKEKESGKYKKVNDVSNYITVHGDLPWVIIDEIKLIKSLLANRSLPVNSKSIDIDKKIVTECINLAHYITDFCTPLHLNKNYDGICSSQNGIHWMWETFIPQLFMKTYKIVVTKLEVDNVEDYFFKNMAFIYEKSEAILNTEFEIFDIYKSRNKQIYYDNRFRTKKYARLAGEYYNKGINEQINLAVSLIVNIFDKLFEN